MYLFSYLFFSSLFRVSVLSSFIFSFHFEDFFSDAEDFEQFKADGLQWPPVSDFFIIFGLSIIVLEHLFVFNYFRKMIIQYIVIYI